jgi:diguanylate cyclase (GGDEF)-like protein/PAS domain S-box-containing protein
MPKLPPLRQPGLTLLLLVNALAIGTLLFLLLLVEPAWRGLAVVIVALSSATLLFGSLRLFRWMRHGKAMLLRSNSELTRNTAYFKALLDHLPQGISVFDEHLQLRFWNRKFIEVLGLPEEVVQPGVHFGELIRFPAERGEYGPGKVDELVRIRVDIASGFQPHQLERTRPNGRTHRVEGAPIMMNGEVRGVVTTYTDITDLKQRNNEWQQKNALLHTILDNMPSGISAFDHDLKMLASNRLAAQLLDLPESLFADGSDFETFIRYNAERGEYGDEAIEASVTRIVAKARLPEAHTFERQRPNGTVIEVRGSPLPGGGFVTIYTDVTDKRRLADETRRRSAYLRAVLEQLPQGVSVFDEKLRLKHWNQLFTEVLELPAEIVHEDVGFDELIMVPALRGEYGPGDPVEQVQARRALAMQFKPHRFERTRPNGKTHLVEGTPLYLEGQLAGFITTYTDISERIAGERAVQSKNTMLQTLIDNIPGGVTLFDADFRLVAYNHEYQRLLDFPAALCEGSPHLEDFFRFNAERGEYGDGNSEALVEQLLARARLRLPHLIERTRPNGTILEIRGLPLPDGGFVSIYTDITERKQAQQTIERLAHFDNLTGLANRYTMEARLDQALADAQRRQQRLALMFIDLDRFKEINDSLGHTVGDAVLIEIAKRLRSAVRDSDVVARLGGDEFVLVMSEVADLQAVAGIADKIIALLTQPLQIDNHLLDTSASLGIALFPDDGADRETLMRNADTAMYHSKSAGRNTFHFFDPRMNAATLARIAMEKALRQAIEEGQFVLHLQPQIRIHDRAAVGMEALLRWVGCDGQLIPPAEFIPVAEECGLILPLGEWVINSAIDTLRRWYDEGLHDIQISINLSIHQLNQPELPEIVAAALRRSGMDPAMVEFEITETVAMHNPAMTISNLQALRRLGVTLALDDFGTGYSSLNYLKLFPINRLKLDRTFVQDINDEPNDAAICAATIGLGHSMGLDVVAEGVETEDQFRQLQRMGCDTIQGYYFSRPLPEAEAKRFFLKRR